MLDDGERIHELADGGVVRVRGVGCWILLEVAGEGKERVERVGGLGGFGVVFGDLVDAEVEGVAVVEAGDEGGLGRDGEFQAEDADVSRSVGAGEGEADVADGPGLPAEKRHVAEAGGEERRAGEGAGGGAAAIEDGVNLLGRRHVGGRDEVVAEDGDAQGAVFRRHGVDGAAGVVFLVDGDRGQIAGEARGVEAAFEDLGEGYGPLGPSGLGMEWSAKATWSRSRSKSMPVASINRW